MDELTNRSEGGIDRLNGLAMEARMYSEAAAMNMLQLGRVLTEAKKLVKHGEWTGWIQTNAHMSETMAQSLMRAYRRFSQTPGIEGLDRSKLFKMLSLPAGTEEQFLEENDVRSMTAREVEQAVKKVRQEAEEKIRKEREARQAAEAYAGELKAKPAEIPREITEALREKDGEIARITAECERLAGQTRDIIIEKNALAREKAEITRDLQETEAMLQEQQEEYNRVQAELLNVQSMAAKGDAERPVSEGLTAADFTRAVGQFIGLVSRVPHMRRAFAGMPYAEREEFDTSLKVVEGWAESARRAINTVEVHMEGLMINAE